jgi:hypothetical protein
MEAVFEALRPAAVKAGMLIRRRSSARWPSSSGANRRLDQPSNSPHVSAMTAQTLIGIDKRRPFQPYSLRLDNGDVVRIEKPEHCLVTEDGRTLVYNEADGKLKFIAIPNVSVVE